MQILSIPDCKKELKKTIKDQKHHLNCLKEIVALTEHHIAVLERKLNPPKVVKSKGEIQKKSEKKTKNSTPKTS